jgi:hypothetical protein
MMQMSIIAPGKPCRVPFTNRFYVRKPIGSNAHWRRTGVVTCSWKGHGQADGKAAAWKGAATALFAGLILVHGPPAIANVKPPTSYESSQAAFEEESRGEDLFERFKKRAAKVPEQVSNVVEKPAKEATKVAEKAPTPDFGRTAVADKPQLEAPPPTEVDEKLPKLALSDKPNQLPEQPKPEPAPKQLPEDSTGGKTQTQKRSGGFLGFLGGGNSGSNPAEKVAGSVAETAKDAGEAVAQSDPVDAVKSAAEKVETPKPSGGFLGFLGGNDSGSNPTAAGSVAKTAEDAKEAVAQSDPVDAVTSAADKIEAPKPSGGFLGFLGGNDSGSNPAETAAGSIANTAEDAKEAVAQSDPVDAVKSAANKVETPKPNGGFLGFLGGGDSGSNPAEKAAGSVAETTKDAGEAVAQSDPVDAVTSAADKIEAPKPSGGFLGFLGGGGSNDNPAMQAADSVVKTAEDAKEAVAQSDPVDAVTSAADKIEAPKPSGGFLGLLGGGKSGNNPVEQAAGSVADATEGAKEAVAQASPVDKVASAGDAVADAGKDAGQAASNVAENVTSAATDAKQGQSGGGIFGFLGGNNNNAVAEKPQLEIPPPTEVEEVLPESAPNDPNVLPEQPKPEPESKQLPQDSPGGEVGETKSGGGFLDFFGGSSKNSQSSVPQGNEGNVVASAADDVKETVSQTAASFSPTALTDQIEEATSDAASPQKEPASLVASTFGGSEAKAAEEGFKIGEQSTEPTKDNIQATIYGLGVVFLLAIGIFTLQGNAAENGHKEH